ncbi:hypothetical protein PCNPT3_02785 [Psychromonas sp. CNPT3]|uniref:AraC family transcriptional regulator n=1 Tax=Psychromonas sp. CNPT3 TaxID=314282 RepID=UPI00006E8ACB|nr:helix-turn-helix transcriptional regulator [Psychromonas sp. CNPT3]AGH80499.1 hypothetical protein PCNPT3_02785 [Psychromonas sp. CNPT3]
MKKTKNVYPHLALDKAPVDVFMNFDVFSSNTETRLHAHDWGQLNFTQGGTLEVHVDKNRFLLPPHLAVWIPAGVEHCSYNRKQLNYCSFNVSNKLSELFPKQTSMMKVNGVVSAIIDVFRKRKLSIAQTEQDKRLVQVLLDQFLESGVEQHFLPTSGHRYLAPILTYIEKDPTSILSLLDWAGKLHTTERTLARIFQSELAMSYTQWRLRMRYLYSLELLQKGETVKSVALSLGYNQASPFICMFKKFAGETPEKYKQQREL